jgi:hypothetical protein
VAELLPDSTPGLMAAWSLAVAICGDDIELAEKLMSRAADAAEWRANLPAHIVPLRGPAGDAKAKLHAEQVAHWWRVARDRYMQVMER